MFELGHATRNAERQSGVQKLTTKSLMSFRISDMHFGVGASVLSSK